MSSKIVRAVQVVGVYPAAYTAGLALGGYLRYQKRAGKLAVINEGELTVRRPHGTLILANHPSIMEPWVLAGLYAPQSLRNPNRMPWSTPDFGNFVSHWYGQWLRVRTIPVYRGNAEKAREMIVEIVAALCRGETVIMFPEGGRTRSVKNGEKHRRSPVTGRLIRPFKCRRLLEALPSETEILSTWIEREWDNRPKVGHGIPDGFKPMIVVFGRAKRRPAWMTAAQAVHWCEDQILALADTLPSQQ